jgi:hypothetical protein
MKTIVKMILLLVVFSAGITANAQDKVYKDGSVWSVSFIKTNSGMGDEYLTNLKSTWKAVNDEALKQGLILSYKILTGMSANPQDWDIMLLVEFKNLASMEGSDDKWDAIMKKVVGDESAQNKLMSTRVSQRTIYGEKLLRELIYK